eukprot:GSA25T00007662001.1
MPHNSTLRVSEGFDYACLVFDRLESIADVKFGKLVLIIVPTDSGGSTGAQK